MKYLKAVIIAIFSILIVGGCASKNTISVKPYESKYAQESIDKTIKLSAINDLRETDVFATVIKNEKPIKQYKSTINIKNWFKDALEKDFSTSGIKISHDALVKLEINIIKFEVKYIKDKSFDKNLFGNVELELIFKKDNITKKKYIKTSHTAWKINIFDAKDFENFVYENLSDSVLNSVKSMVTTLKNDID